MAALRVLAARDMAAERRRAAGLDGAHHLQLCVAHVAAVGITPSGTVVAEDIRDLQSGTLHDGAAATSAGSVLGRSDVSMIERARDLAQHLGRDVGVARRRVELRMAERARVIMHVLLTH